MAGNRLGDSGPVLYLSLFFRYLQNRPPVQTTGGLFGRGRPTLALAPWPSGTAALNIDYMCLRVPGRRFIHIISSDLSGEPSSTIAVAKRSPSRSVFQCCIRRENHPWRPTKNGLLTIVDVVRETRMKLIVGGCPQSDRKPQLPFTFSLLVILGQHGMLPKVRTG
jgi:hypothetical protein